MNDYFIIMENEPTIEDLRAEILDYKKQLEQQSTTIENLTNQITTKDTTIENLNNQISTKDSTIENLNKDIGQLKQKNYDLFMQVSNNPQEPSREKEKEVISLDTIINNLRGEN